MKNVLSMAYRKPLNYEGLLKLDLQFFAEGGEEQQQQSDQAENLGGQEQQQDTQQQQEKLLPQSDVNNLVAKKTKEAQEKLLKQLGMEDFNSAKEGLEKFKKWQESQKTEAEKQQEQLQSLETNFQTVSEENSTLKAQLAAFKVGVTDEKHLDAVITLAKTRVTEEVDINAAIQSVIEDFPHFKGEVQQEQQQEVPKWTTGQHNKQPVTELDKWITEFSKKK